ncbi:hypothetical protein [Kineococcus sp. SYSU DK002]|uniref:hypothetical protein n=1 Tax=Kineococcus sp. SYSU DK002 TaxID=3383123 RepID=UPI003D7E3132
MVDLQDLVLRDGDTVDVDGQVIEVEGALHLAPLGDEGGPRPGLPCGEGVPVQFPPGVKPAVTSIASVHGVWAGGGVEAHTVGPAPTPRVVGSLTPVRSDADTWAECPADERSAALPRDPALEAAMSYLVSEEVGEDLMFAFGESRVSDRTVGQAWFTRMTSEVAERLRAVPDDLLLVDVWLRPA